MKFRRDFVGDEDNSGWKVEFDIALPMGPRWMRRFWIPRKWKLAFPKVTSLGCYENEEYVTPIVDQILKNLQKKLRHVLYDSNLNTSRETMQ